MDAEPPPHLTARRTPRQARSEVTREAILEATLHVLIKSGVRRLTTTRVADRAGVSVGSLYQYFPHKEALLYATNAHYLEKVAVAVEGACQRAQGRPLAEMVAALVSAYSGVKLENPAGTRALYRAVAELDTQSQIDTFTDRVDAATLGMLRSAPDGQFDNLELVNLTLLTVVFGAVRNAFERNLSIPEALAVHDQVRAMCLSYLRSVRSPVLSN